MTDGKKIIGCQCIHLNETDSTNNHLNNLLKTGENIPEGMTVKAGHQTNGRGMARNQWISEQDKNLTFSFVIYPDFIEPENQFVISKIIALGIAEFLMEVTSGIAIKWPNDILVNNQKTGGILIENRLNEKEILYSVVGIGLNVNQKTFPEEISHAVSLSAITGEQYDLEQCFDQLIHSLNKWYIKLKHSDDYSLIHQQYQYLLYRRGEQVCFKTSLRRFRAEIIGVDKYGQLVLKNTKGQLERFGFKTIEMVDETGRHAE
jgi:BirA family biotin operon repressor/biotin-[acetyl-CoA-carboxylase] ligase